ncbi:MAG: hypothetical protein IT463_04640 [Planctomycetes bacterium]|nr:hypothetical protein [Planctomycetota bacterium]
MADPMKTPAHGKVLRFARAAAALLPLLWNTGCGGTATTLAAEDEGLIVIRRSEAEDPKSIDPHKTGDVISSRHASMAYEALLEYDFLERPAKLIPCLAESLPQYDAATNTYTFRLRDDVYFSDDRCFHPDATGRTFEEEGLGPQGTKGPGRKLVAADLAYSFKRLAALPDSEGFWVIEGKVAGLDAFHAEAAPLKKDNYAEDAEWRAKLEEPVEGLSTPDDRTLKVRLTEPYPQFLYAISMTYGAAVAREACDYYGKELARHAVGTGPYLLTQWRFNSQITWERNPNFRKQYFPTSDKPEHARFKPYMGKQLPLADKVVYRIIKESQTDFLEFMQGNLDVCGIDKDQFSAAVTTQSEVTPKLAERGIQLLKYAEPTISYISFNMNDPDVGTPGGEKARAIRRALCLCIDRDDHIRRYLNGRGEPARQLVPPGTWGHAAGCEMAVQQYDPARGREILTEAGFQLEKQGETLYRAVDPATGKQVVVNVLLRRNDAQAGDYVTFLKACGDKVGINLQAERMTFAEFLKRQNEGTGQAYDAGWVMDYPDAQNMLQLLYGPNKPPGINSASYASPEYDRLYKEMSVLDETDPMQKQRKAELIAAMHKELDKDAPWVVLNFRKTYSLYHSWYAQPDPNPFAYTYVKFIYSDTPSRAQRATSWAERPLLPALVMLGLLLLPAGLMGARILKQGR